MLGVGASIFGNLTKLLAPSPEVNTHQAPALPAHRSLMSPVRVGTSGPWFRWGHGLREVKGRPTPHGRWHRLSPVPVGRTLTCSLSLVGVCRPP